MNSPYHILIILSGLVLLSYLFNQVADRLRLPAVLLLIGTGIGLQYLAKSQGYEFPDTRLLLELLGIVGLIIIVLEGSLDLELSREKLPLIGRSFLAALLILLATSGLICWLFYELLELPLRQAAVYAVSLGVISSSIAIPSVGKLARAKKEFIIYESTFSDIIGIMLFNYLVQDQPMSTQAVGDFFLGFLYILLISAASTTLLLLLLSYTRSHVKFFLIFAFLVLIYAFSKLLHLPSLLLILFFGLMLNNAGLFIKGKVRRFLHVEKLKQVTTEVNLLTVETAFVIRTFFFLLFGYSIDPMLLADAQVPIVGGAVLLIILLTRFIFLRFISHVNVFPEMFIAPRGLITIILFYSIPASLKIKPFNEGILLFVILGSSLLMMLGLLISGRQYSNEMDPMREENE